MKRRLRFFGWLFAAGWLVLLAGFIAMSAAPPGDFSSLSFQIFAVAAFAAIVLWFLAFMSLIVGLESR